MTDVRVTQAGRQAAIQPEADVRVTQAGRQAAIQPGADVRVTQAGRQAAILVGTGDLRVTLMGRQVLMPKPSPTAPLLLSPEDGETYTLSANVVYTESTDPLGGTITYTFQYSVTGMGSWNTVFTGRSGNDPYVWDISGLADGDYDVRLWASATGGTGDDSAIATATITVDNTSPGPPNITAPYDGQEWIPQNPQRIEWEAAEDPNSLPLTYKIDYRAVGAGSWTSVTTGLTTLYYDWDVSAFAADDYEVRVYANNGTADGTPDVQQFVITTADRPATPAIRITGVSDTCVTVELSPYSHPTPRAWASTTYIVVPYGGDPSNPLITYTTTDPAEQSTATICGLPQGFHGQIYAYYTDNAANDSLNSYTTEYTLGDFSRRFVPRWDTSAYWQGGGPGELTGRNEPDAFFDAQPQAAAVLEDAGSIGSIRLSGYVMLGGCHCGWLGRDTELRTLGIGIYEGYADDNTWEGVNIGLDANISNSAAQGTIATVTADIFVEVRWPDGTRTWTTVPIGWIMAQVIGGYTNTIGSPIGPWGTDQSRDPWYRIDAIINRDMTPGANTTRIRAKVHRAVGSGGLGDEGVEAVPDDEWHIDVTYNKTGPCGIPGYSLSQDAYAWNSARNYYRDLEFTFLRDLGIPGATTTPQPAYNGPGEPGACTPQAETALPAPVLFPIPPNGDVTERVTYPTDVIETWDDTEQRISLRERAVLSVGWTGTALTSQEATQLAALLYDKMPSRWIVPLWQDATPLLANLPSVSGTIPAASVDLEDRRFDRMTHVLLWVDQFTWHVTTATVENNGDITLDTSTTQLFVGGAKGPTWVVPCRIGRMPQSVEASRAAPFTSETTFEFILEGVND